MIHNIMQNLDFQVSARRKKRGARGESTERSLEDGKRIKLFVNAVLADDKV